MKSIYSIAHSKTHLLPTLRDLLLRRWVSSKGASLYHDPSASLPLPTTAAGRTRMGIVTSGKPVGNIRDTMWPGIKI